MYWEDERRTRSKVGTDNVGFDGGAGAPEGGAFRRRF